MSFLAKFSLAGLDEPSWKRVAYYAGLVTMLKIARKMMENKVTDIDPHLYPILKGEIFPVPATKFFVWSIAEYTLPHVSIDLGDLNEWGLRHGRITGPLYFAGMSDALKVALFQVPNAFKYLTSEWRQRTIEWIGDRIVYADIKLKTEKKLI